MLALPTSVTPDGDGYLIVDAQQAPVLRFDRSGRLTRTYGREGDGPGELREAAAALPWRGDTILVLSWSPSAAQLFQRSSGDFVRRVALDGPIESAELDGTAAWISGARYGDDTGVRRVDLVTGDEGAGVAPLPADFAHGDPLGGIFPMVSFTRWADTLLVGYEPTDQLLVVTVAGAVADTVNVPARARRGVPDDAAAALLDAMRRGPYNRVFGVLSALRAMHRRSDGSTLLVHFDSRPEGPPVTSQAFVTVLSADRTRACVDAPVPLSPEAQPAVGFQGDDLLVLEQVIRGGDAVPVLRRIAVEAGDCAWVPTG